MIGMARVTQQSLYRRIATVGRLVDLMSIVNSLRRYRRKLVRAKAEERWGGVGGTKPIGWFSTASFDWHQAGGNAHIFAWNIHNLWEMSAHPIDPYWLTLYFALPRSQISKSAVRNRITCHVPALSLSRILQSVGGKVVSAIEMSSIDFCTAHPSRSLSISIGKRNRFEMLLMEWKLNVYFPGKGHKS